MSNVSSDETGCKFAATSWNLAQVLLMPST